MGDIFNFLGRAIEGSTLIALPASFIWGVLSIVLSPCHLASIPLVVGYIEEQGSISTKKAFRISSMFSLGFLLVIALVGIITSAAGRMMGDIGSVGYYIISAVLIIFGLHLLDVVPMPWQGSKNRKVKRKGYRGALILGIIFGAALGPCTFAFMAPILGVVFSTGSSNFVYALLLMAVFAIGHCGVIVAAGTFAEAVQVYLHWNERSKGIAVLRKVCGGLVVLAGIYLLYKYG